MTETVVEAAIVSLWKQINEIVKANAAIFVSHCCTFVYAFIRFFSVFALANIEETIEFITGNYYYMRGISSEKENNHRFYQNIKLIR